jgi:hypothetical protein
MPDLPPPYAPWLSLIFSIVKRGTYRK